MNTGRDVKTAQTKYALNWLFDFPDNDYFVQAAKGNEDKAKSLRKTARNRQFEDLGRIFRSRFTK